ncbi:hypothetical protein QR680_012859 [Steinernema hermaphroditum]|uniref:Uncharacterized protein n=1 Tax=Steinernema hermaphroditum TaxID=289476 RepID=A0AA39I3I1_9BILA|nr:hypothetical protein QR680_012859 [Steinernema hermaphroditum]
MSTVRSTGLSSGAPFYAVYEAGLIRRENGVLTRLSSAIVCVTLLNREEGDQVKVSHEEYLEFEMRPFRLVTTYIKERI